jgi:hypothetical protein
MAWPHPQIGVIPQVPRSLVGYKFQAEERAALFNLRCHGKTVRFCHGVKPMVSSEDFPKRSRSWTEIATCLVMKNCWKWTFPTFDDGDFPKRCFPKNSAAAPLKMFYSLQVPDRPERKPVHHLVLRQGGRGQGVDPVAGVENPRILIPRDSNGIPIKIIKMTIKWHWMAPHFQSHIRVGTPSMCCDFWACLPLEDEDYTCSVHLWLPVRNLGLPLPENG